VEGRRGGDERREAACAQELSGQACGASESPSTSIHSASERI
jgi:hypothetical protein